MSPNIVLVACASKKLTKAAPAKDIYQSTLFLKSRAWAEAATHPWFILSAKYGLVPPDKIISPYDLTLNTKDKTYRQAWSVQVLSALKIVVPPPHNLIFLAGRKYREGLIPNAELDGYTCEIPMRGLGIGKQLQWLSRNSGDRDQLV